MKPTEADEKEPLRLTGEQWADLTLTDGVGPLGLLLLPLASLLVWIKKGRGFFRRK